jgi:hypothetical protein
MVKSCGSVALLARIVSYPDRVVTRSDGFLWDKKDEKGRAIWRRLSTFRWEQLLGVNRTNKKWPPTKDGHSCVGKLVKTA